MNSTEWDDSGWNKFKNPSGEVVRKKQYIRHLLSYVNAVPDCIKARKKLADLLQIPTDDLMGDLRITIDITKHKHTTIMYNLKRYRRFINR